MSVDLADEQTTSNQASEILETEQAERRRLEKEVKELTVSELLSEGKYFCDCQL